MRKFILTVLMATSGITIAASPALAMDEKPVLAADKPADPVQQKLAETMAGKIIPVGSYEKMMKDISDQMVDGMLQQMMGMDAAAIVKSAGEDASVVEGKSLGDIASEADPHFKERMDIMMKVTFDEMGKLMSAMEPEARSALAKIYARKYTTKQLTDMNSFFATPSGTAFAADFMSTFTDKEMMSAMMGQMPKMLEAMPAIVKKAEEATAHLPLPEKAETSMAGAEETADADPFANDNGTEPWWDRTNWDKADQKKIAQLESKSDALSEQSSAASAAYLDFETEVMLRVRERYLAKGWKPAASSE